MSFLIQSSAWFLFWYRLLTCRLTECETPKPLRHLPHRSVPCHRKTGAFPLPCLVSIPLGNLIVFEVGSNCQIIFFFFYSFDSCKVPLSKVGVWFPFAGKPAPTPSYFGCEEDIKSCNASFRTSRPGNFCTDFGIKLFLSLGSTALVVSRCQFEADTVSLLSSLIYSLPAILEGFLVTTSHLQRFIYSSQAFFFLGGSKFTWLFLQLQHHHHAASSFAEFSSFIQNSLPSVCPRHGSWVQRASGY